MIRKPAAGVESCEENTNIVRSGNRGDKTSSDSLVLCRCSQQSTGGREHAAKSDNYCVRGEKKLRVHFNFGFYSRERRYSPQHGEKSNWREMKDFINGIILIKVRWCECNDNISSNGALVVKSPVMSPGRMFLTYLWTSWASAAKHQSSELWPGVSGI